jgi:hypothetical protein
MPTVGERWPDARLDAFYAEFQRILVMVEKVAVLEVDLRNVAEDVTASRNNLHRLRNELAATSVGLRNDLAAAQRAQAEEQRAAAVERKRDRKWFIGISLTATPLVITAIGLLAGHIR